MDFVIAPISAPGDFPMFVEGVYEPAGYSDPSRFS